MQDIIILLLVVLIVVIFLGSGWLFTRTVRELRESMEHQLEINTEEIRSQVQQEMAVLRQALTRTSGQGQWGQMHLEQIVDLAGIRPYCTFQPKFILPSGGHQIPDLQVALPHGRKILVDVKAPLDTYLQTHETSDEGTRMKSMLEYAENVRRNMLGLAKKEYWKLVAPSPAWVVLLIPNEGMFRAALEHDPTLLDTVIKQHILLTSPITLLALLKAMDYSWKQEKLSANTQQIIEQSQYLHEALQRFVTEWQSLRNELGQVSTALNKCMTTYQQILFPIVEQICTLDGTDAAQYGLRDAQASCTKTDCRSSRSGRETPAEWEAQGR